MFDSQDIKYDNFDFKPNFNNFKKITKSFLKIKEEIFDFNYLFDLSLKEEVSFLNLCKSNFYLYKAYNCIEYIYRDNENDIMIILTFDKATNKDNWGINTYYSDIGIGKYQDEILKKIKNESYEPLNKYYSNLNVHEFKRRIIEINKDLTYFLKTI